MDWIEELKKLLDEVDALPIVTKEKIYQTLALLQRGQSPYRPLKIVLLEVSLTLLQTIVDEGHEKRIDAIIEDMKLSEKMHSTQTFNA